MQHQTTPSPQSQSIVFYNRLPFRIGIFAGLTTGLLVVLTLFWVSSFASKTLEEENTRKTQAISHLLSSNIQAFFSFEQQQTTSNETQYKKTQELISNLAPKLEGLLFLELRNANATPILRWKENESSSQL